MASFLAAQDKISSVAFHWRRINLSLTIFHSIFLQNMQFQKDRNYNHPFAYTLIEKSVWLSRIHQVHSHIVIKHFIDTQFKLDFKLSPIYIWPLEQRFRKQHQLRSWNSCTCSWFTGQKGILTFLCIVKKDLKHLSSPSALHISFCIATIVELLSHHFGSAKHQYLLPWIVEAIANPKLLLITDTGLLLSVIMATIIIRTKKEISDYNGNRSTSFYTFVIKIVNTVP